MGAETTLAWDDATARTVEAAVRAAYPEEACGLLLGRSGAISLALPLANSANDRLRGYRIEPADLAWAHGEASKRGLEVIGVFHSHPDGDTRFTTTDQAAAQVGWLYVVVATRGSEPSAISAHQL